MDNRGWARAYTVRSLSVCVFVVSITQSYWWTFTKSEEQVDRAD